MGTCSVVPKMAAGAFFGQPCHALATPSFEFFELEATVPEREVPRHTHETPHFILITGGVYVTEARNHRGICLPGTLVFNPAGTTHRDCFRSQRGMFIGISPGVEISRWLDRAPSIPLVVNGDKGAQHRNNHNAHDQEGPADRIIFELGRELRQKADSSAILLEALGLELIGAVAGIGDRAASLAAPSWLVRAKEMIEDCLEWNLTVAKLAESVDVHPVYLARAYRRYFRCSPGDHLRRCRVLRVRELLSSTHLPLVEIALRCGFSDQSQMTRLFSRSFGVSPARYRSLLD